MLALRPDMASLSTGSCNFPTRVYENSPELIDWLAGLMLEHEVKPEIEVFDLSMLFKAVEMAKAGRIRGPLHVQFVMGVKNAMPVDREVFDFYVRTVRRLAPDATWTGAGIGRDQLTLVRWSLEAAATAAPGSRTISGSIGRRWRPRTPPWSRLARARPHRDPLPRLHDPRHPRRPARARRGAGRGDAGGL
jgi:hypothetical protein